MKGWMSAKITLRLIKEETELGPPYSRFSPSTVDVCLNRG